jgi:hypothetical protein
VPADADADLRTEQEGIDGMGDKKTRDLALELWQRRGHGQGQVVISLWFTVNIKLHLSYFPLYIVELHANRGDASVGVGRQKALKKFFLFRAVVSERAGNAGKRCYFYSTPPSLSAGQLTCLALAAWPNQIAAVPSEMTTQDFTLTPARRPLWPDLLQLREVPHPIILIVTIISI